MKWFVRAMLCALVPLLSSCQTEPKTSPLTTTAIERTVYIDATCASDAAILISKDDKLTDLTKEAIGDHNNALWCRCPAKRPVGFDAKTICKI